MQGGKTFKGVLGVLAAVGMLAGCGPESEAEEGLGEAQQALTTCTYRIAVTGVRAIDGQGAFEGDMEVRLTATQGTGSVVLPGSTTYFSLNPDPQAPWNGLNGEVSRVSVSDSRTVTVDVDVLELDSGTLGADDYGSRSVSLTLTCGGSPQVVTPDISLFRDNMGSYDGKVEVRLRAEQL
jgi:hypothetical protein